MNGWRKFLNMNTGHVASTCKSALGGTLMTKIKQKIYKKQRNSGEIRGENLPFSDFEKTEILQPSIDKKRYVWEIEIEAYRRQKRWNVFFAFGAICGMISLLISGFILWGLAVGFF